MTQSTKITGTTLAIVAGAMLVFAGVLANVNDVSATKYERSQISLGTNDCGNGKLPLNIFCQNIASQIDGEGNAINIIALPPPSGDDDLQLLPE
jgi:dipeptide/tripeptide permease